jgi:hypothetical protein
LSYQFLGVNFNFGFGRFWLVLDSVYPCAHQDVKNTIADIFLFNHALAFERSAKGITIQVGQNSGQIGQGSGK